MEECFMSNEEIADEIIKRLKEKTSRKCLNFSVSSEKVGLMGNKIGGVPFMPKGSEYPVNPLNGEKLYLLAQLNFETLPRLDNYPERGILQFFIEDDYMYGADLDFKKKPIEQNAWRVIYYDDVSNPMSEDDIKKIMPEEADEYALPFEYGKEFKLDFEECEMPITESDFRFTRALQKYCGDILEVDSILDIPDDIGDIIFEELFGEKTRLGGYPCFTQFDPREEIDDNDYELLFQIVSEFDEKEGDYLIIWGDAGIANFFIKTEDLLNCEFSRVLYNWDCS